MRKHFLLFTFLLIGSYTYSQQSEYYFRFIEPNKQTIGSILTQIISIDNVVNDTVYAYSNEVEFATFSKFGYKVEMLPAPSSVNAKATVMATTVGEMANWDRYPTYQVYRAMMKKFVQDYPALCKLDSVGTSVQGRKLYSLKISDNVAQHEAEPEFLYSSTMHGDETTGFVLLLRLAHYLLSQYATNTDIQNLVNTTQIYIMPNTNPDGTYYSGNHTVSGSRRYNANSVDLNRNYPGPAHGQHPDGSSWQPETIDQMAYAGNHNFVMSANLHGGIELVNYPWDCWYSTENKHADHNWYHSVSTAYANTVHAINSSYLTGQNNGVTHGADWYKAPGSRQDYMNAYRNCREITLELSNTKCPSSDALPTFWNYNYQALINYIKCVHTGFKGTVTGTGNSPISATVTVLSHDKDGSQVVTNATNGDYYRPIEPGTYSVKYTATGYQPQTRTITIASYTTSLVENVMLVPLEAATLTGVVTDAATGNPLYGATVTIEGVTATSNSSGAYNLSTFAGSYEVLVNCTNYTSRTVPVTLQAGSNVINFQLNLSQAENFESGIPDGISFTGGDWTRSNTAAYNGQYSMKSAAIGNNASTSMQLAIRFAEAGEFSFARKVSSESNYDFLKFYIDGVEKGKWSGSQDWSIVTYPVTAGAHTFNWTYSKDNSTAQGSDCAWVDYIETPSTQQDVIFTVTFNGVVQQGLAVSFNGTSQTTDAQGKATFFNVARANNLPFTVLKGSNQIATGSVNVGWSDVNKTVNVEYFYTATFKVVSTDGSVLENAKVLFNSTQQMTSSSGVATFTQVPYSSSLPYTITKTGFLPYTANTKITGDTTINVTIEPKVKGIVTFRVTGNGSPISGAKVSFNSTEQTTTSTGIASFNNVPFATSHTYTIVKDGFFTASASIVPTSDTTINVNLNKNTGNVKFKTTSNGTPIQGVTVKFNNKEVVSSSTGTATFVSVPLLVQLQYTATKDGYNSISGNITAHADTTVTISLTLTGINHSSISEMSVWPNPFTTSAKIDIGSDACANITVDIYNILGQKVACVFDGPISNGSRQVEWTPNNQPKGIYFVVVKPENGNSTMRKLIYR